MSSIRVCFFVVLGILPGNMLAGMVGWWRLDGDCLDSSSERNHGQLVGDGVFDTDVPEAIRHGKSLLLSGQEFIKVPNSLELSLKTELSISAWVKPLSNNGWHGIVAKGPKWGNWDGAPGNYEFRIDDETRNPSFFHQQEIFQ